MVLILQANCKIPHFQTLFPKQENSRSLPVDTEKELRTG